MTAHVRRWQDYDCPNSGMDFDLDGDAMVYDGDSFYCSGCGSHHIATPELVRQYEQSDNAPARAVPLQKRPVTASR